MSAFGPPGPAASRSTVVHDPFDVEAFEGILPRAPGLRLLLEGADHPFARELAFDLFCSFYKYFIKVLTPEGVAPEYRRHRDLLRRALELREHEKLRALTRLKSPETALATELVLDGLLRELARAKREEPAASPRPEEEPAPPDSSETERLREVLRDARDDLQHAVELVAAWTQGAGQETRLPGELKLRLMRELVRDPRLQRIAQLFARYRRFGVQARDLRALRTAHEVVDFVQGGDVARALAGELSSFALEEREDLFYAKVVTRSLLLYELWRQEDEPRAVYLCVDNSGSMAGDKEVWAKASALSLAHLALSHRRPVEVVLFGDAADPLRVVPMAPEDDGPTRLSKLMDVATYFLGGGTDFVKPLSHVLERIESQGHVGNDVLFVSDGLCPIPDDFVRRFREVKARYDLRMTSVLVGEDAHSLATISDHVHQLDEALEEAEALAAHFATAFLERTPERGVAPAPRLKVGRGTPLLFDHFLPGPDEG